MFSAPDEILPNLFISSLRLAADPVVIHKYKITHIVSIQNNPKKLIGDVAYHLEEANDDHTTQILPILQRSIPFIHRARIQGGRVLVQCVMGVSRSVSVVVGYLVCWLSGGCEAEEVTNEKVLCAVQTVREFAQPNISFRHQLSHWESSEAMKTVQKSLMEMEASNCYSSSPQQTNAICLADDLKFFNQLLAANKRKQNLAYLHELEKKKNGNS